MNLCTFSGRIGRDPELRHMPNGDAVLGWPLAVDTGTKDKPATMWIDCSIFGRRAESLQAYMATGDKLIVSGRLTQNEFKGKDGTPKQGLRLSVDQVELAGGKKSDQAAPAPAAAARPKASASPREEFDDDPIPF